MKPAPNIVYTIGHSNHSADRFVELLERHGIEVLVDVRSRPSSRFSPHFAKKRLSRRLAEQGLEYRFLGAELGGMPDEDRFYDSDGYVLYDRLAASERFTRGIAALVEIAADRRTALMCGEENPTGCHRRLLLGRALIDRGVELLHVRGDGRVERDADLKPVQGDIFGSGAARSVKPVRGRS